MELSIHYLNNDQEREYLVTLDEMCSAKVVFDEDFQREVIVPQPYLWDKKKIYNYDGLIAVSVMNDRKYNGFICYRKNKETKETTIEKISATHKNYDKIVNFLLDHREQSDSYCKKIIIRCSQFDDRLAASLKGRGYLAKKVDGDFYIFERTL